MVEPVRGNLAPRRTQPPDDPEPGSKCPDNKTNHYKLADRPSRRLMAPPYQIGAAFSPNPNPGEQLHQEQTKQKAHAAPHNALQEAVGAPLLHQQSIEVPTQFMRFVR